MGAEAGAEESSGEKNEKRASDRGLAVAAKAGNAGRCWRDWLTSYIHVVIDSLT